MKLLSFSLLLIVCAFASAGSAQTAGKPNPNYDAELAKKLGADERGMKMYVMCILKTGPKDAEFKGKERQDIFAGHFANINKLADEGKLAVAGPFGKNDKTYRGLYIFNVATIEEAEKLVVLDPGMSARDVLAEDQSRMRSRALRLEQEHLHGAAFDADGLDAVGHGSLLEGIRKDAMRAQ